MIIQTQAEWMGALSVASTKVEPKMQQLIDHLGYVFLRPELLEQALTHKSFRNENPAVASGDNERLEFLGDAVLDLALSEYLMERFSADQEGSLSKKRASLVNEEELAAIAREIGVDTHLRLGKGERQTGGLQKPRILASALEAVLGSIFLDQGYTAARNTVVRLFEPRMEIFGKGSADFARDFKTRLQELVQEKFRQTPTYHVVREEGPDHDKVFEVSVRLEARALAAGTGRSKKSAEQEAARLALETFVSASEPYNEQSNEETMETPE